MNIAGTHQGNTHWEGITTERARAQGLYIVNRTLSRPKAGIEERVGVEREYTVGHKRITATSTKDAVLKVIAEQRALWAEGKMSRRWTHITCTCKARGEDSYRLSHISLKVED